MRPRCKHKGCTTGGRYWSRQLCRIHYLDVMGRHLRKCESCDAVADCMGEARWCRDCFHRWCETRRERVFRARSLGNIRSTEVAA